MPAFTCALPLSAGRTGQQDDLLPEFDVEIMPGMALILLSPCLASFSLPVACSFTFTDQSKLSLTNKCAQVKVTACTVCKTMSNHQEFPTTPASKLKGITCCLNDGFLSRFGFSAHPEEVCHYGLDDYRCDHRLVWPGEWFMSDVWCSVISNLSLLTASFFLLIFFANDQDYTIITEKWDHWGWVWVRSKKNGSTDKIGVSWVLFVTIINYKCYFTNIQTDSVVAK